jgi:sugar phosphate permease
MHGRISFLKAWTVPRVALYAASFFCTKLCVYVLLLWIPVVFGAAPFKYEGFEIANIQTAVDVGAVIGSMVLGYASDLMHGVRSPIALLAVVAATILSWSITIFIQDMSYAVLLVIFFFQGFFINSLNNIISSVCAADIGKQTAL